MATSAAGALLTLGNNSLRRAELALGLIDEPLREATMPVQILHASDAREIAENARNAMVDWDDVNRTLISLGAHIERAAMFGMSQAITVTASRTHPGIAAATAETVCIALRSLGYDAECRPRGDQGVCGAGRWTTFEIVARWRSDPRE